MNERMIIRATTAEAERDHMAIEREHAWAAKYEAEAERDTALAKLKRVEAVRSEIGGDSADVTLTDDLREYAEDRGSLLDAALSDQEESPSAHVGPVLRPKLEPLPVIPLEPLKAWLEERIAELEPQTSLAAVGLADPGFKAVTNAFKSVLTYLDSKGELE